MKRITAALLLATASLTACKKTPPPAPAPQPVAEPQSTLQPAAPVDPNTAGRLVGFVSFSGPAPERSSINMSADPACLKSNDRNLSETAVVANDKLANVYIYVKSGATPSLALPTEAPAIMNQRGCRFIPHVVAVQQGSLVQFRNADMSTHNVTVAPTQPGNDAIDVSQSPMGSPDSERLGTVETMIPVHSTTHPWMNGYINVAPNPFFAVSDSDGSFIIPGLPPGTYTLAAVHEKYGERDIQVTITPKETTRAVFAFTAK
jgi:plastocyanin